MTRKVSARRAGLGAVVWLVAVAWRVPNAWHGAWAQALLLFAALVLVPLAWPLILGGTPGALLRAAGRLQWPAAVVLAVGIWWPRGFVAVALALPWIAVTALLAASGAVEFWRERPRAAAARCRLAALLFIAIGGVWLAADRVGFRPLGFSEDIVVLTAVHFHYAGLVLPLVTSAAVRELPGAWSGRLAVVGVIVGVPLVAVGITTAQLHMLPGLEAVAAVWLGLTGWLVAGLHWRLAGEARWRWGARVGWAVAGVSLAFGMSLAMLYGARGYFHPLPWLDLPWMRALHGTANAVGFAFCALLAWRGARTPQSGGRG
ncbi:YndJ family protein [Horticoccus luteus]|uniref:YndJ family protein n=1 Tax=Horticoccus luteus TaxID=2862869 RepID=A0A8F9TVQ4_9BACT|nr:YndJ family transporter [Horticoccus luteus]QYM79996.1 YndJ family protein [Horticoccus luteus]